MYFRVFVKAPKTCFRLVTIKLSCFEPYLIKNNGLAFCC